MPFSFLLLIVLASLLTRPVHASPDTTLFPTLPFLTFAEVMKQEFTESVSFSTVLIIFMFIMKNPRLWRLHFRSRFTIHDGEKTRNSKTEGWIGCASSILLQYLEEQQSLPPGFTNTKSSRTRFASSLEKLADILGRNTYPVTYAFNDDNSPPPLPPSLPALDQDIPELLLTFHVECISPGCNRRRLRKVERDENVSKAILIRNMTSVPVYHVAATCVSCNRWYWADSITTVGDSPGRRDRLHDPSAKELFLGKNLYGDLQFSRFVENIIYYCHGSFSGISKVFSDTFGLLAAGSNWSSPAQNSTMQGKHVWQAFFQYSIRKFSSALGISFTTDAKIKPSVASESAWRQLGKNGVLPGGLRHGCIECTHPHHTMPCFQDISPTSTPTNSSNLHSSSPHEVIGENGNERVAKVSLLRPL
jgi:CxC5 like cysteine cluster associated with KDZ transposases